MEPEQPVADDGVQLPAVPAEPAGDLDPGVAALRARGAHHMDPVRFAFLEALATRTRAQRGELRRQLDQRLLHAVAAYGAHHEVAVADLDTRLAGVIRQHPHAASELRRLRDGGDPMALRRRLVRLGLESTGGPLADLVRRIDLQSTTSGQSATNGPAEVNAPGVAAATDATPLRELRTVQRFRATWTRLRIDDHLSRSRQQAPENPGPLNSHLLVLRTLHQLQELAPAYLESLMAHVEALTWVDAAGLPKPIAAGTTAVRDRRKRNGKAGTE